ncbi:hypothetical protein, partial [Enterococcus sp. DIV0788_1]
ANQSNKNNQGNQSNNARNSKKAQSNEPRITDQQKNDIEALLAILSVRLGKASVDILAENKANSYRFFKVDQANRFIKKLKKMISELDAKEEQERQEAKAEEQKYDQTLQKPTDNNDDSEEITLFDDRHLSLVGKQKDEELNDRPYPEQEEG